MAHHTKFYSIWCSTSAFNKFSNSIQDLSNFTIHPDIQAIPSQKIQLFGNVINDFDYYCNWLQLAEKQLKSFQIQIPNPNLLWGLPVLVRICKIFVFYIKSFILLQEVSDSITTCWVGCRSTEKKIACSKESRYSDFSTSKIAIIIFIRSFITNEIPAFNNYNQNIFYICSKFWSSLIIWLVCCQQFNKPS